TIDDDTWLYLSSLFKTQGENRFREGPAGALRRNGLAFGRVVIFFVFIFLSMMGFMNCIDCNPVPPWNQESFSQGAFKQRLAQSDSRLQFDLEIALSGFPAKIQPHKLLQPSRSKLKRRMT